MTAAELDRVYPAHHGGVHQPLRHETHLHHRHGERQCNDTAEFGAPEGRKADRRAPRAAPGREDNQDAADTGL